MDDDRHDDDTKKSRRFFARKPHAAADKDDLTADRRIEESDIEENKKNIQRSVRSHATIEGSE